MAEHIATMKIAPQLIDEPSRTTSLRCRRKTLRFLVDRSKAKFGIVLLCDGKRLKGQRPDHFRQRVGSTDR